MTNILLNAIRDGDTYTLSKMKDIKTDENLLFYALEHGTISTFLYIFPMSYNKMLIKKLYIKSLECDKLFITKYLYNLLISFKDEF